MAGMYWHQPHPHYSGPPSATRSRLRGQNPGHTDLGWLLYGNPGTTQNPRMGSPCNSGANQ
eukprot:14075552-Heterocapsa_arctica.AAC.1